MFNKIKAMIDVNNYKDFTENQFYKMYDYCNDCGGCDGIKKHCKVTILQKLNEKIGTLKRLKRAENEICESIVQLQIELQELYR